MAFLVWGFKAIISNTNNTKQQEASAPNIQAGQVYVSQPGNLVCATEQGLIDAIHLAAGGDVKSFQRVLVSNGGQCMEFPEGVRIKVTEIDARQSSGHALIKFVPENSHGASGVWASDALVLAPKKT